MSDQIISLSDLKPETQQPQEQPQVVQTESAQPNLVELNIGSIAKPKEEVDAKTAAVNDLFGSLEIALNRNKEEISKNLIEPAKEQVILNKYDLEDDEVPTQTKQIQKPASDDDDEEDDSKKEENQFTEIDDEDLTYLDDEFEDEDVSLLEQVEEKVKQENMKRLAAFKDEVNLMIKPKQDKFDLSKFTVSKKPISLSKILTGNVVEQKNVSDWVMYSTGRPFSSSELSGAEIEKINPQTSGRNRLNTYRTMYEVFYNHLVDDNKPATLEAWVKTIKYFDIMDVYFGQYKATFEKSNYVPYNCPHCKNIFLELKDIWEMVKYPTPEAEAKLKAILNRDTTSPSEVEAQLVQVSNNYAISFRAPTVYSVIFENSVLSEDFTSKYSELLGVISYIEDIYLIKQDTMELVPIDTKPVYDNLGKSVRRKIKIYNDIIRTFKSDEYSVILTTMNQINKENEKNIIRYVIPETNCKKCGKTIKEEQKNPLDLLFTRHQLVVIANM